MRPAGGGAEPPARRLNLSEGLWAPRAQVKPDEEARLESRHGDTTGWCRRASTSKHEEGSLEPDADDDSMIGKGPASCSQLEWLVLMPRACRKAGGSMVHDRLNTPAIGRSRPLLPAVGTWASTSLGGSAAEGVSRLGVARRRGWPPVEGSTGCAGYGAPGRSSSPKGESGGGEGPCCPPVLTSKERQKIRMLVSSRTA